VEVGDLVRLLTLQTGVSSILEFTVPQDSPLIGHALGSVALPLDCAVVAILRDDAPITPSPDDTVEAGDELFFLAAVAAENELRQALSARSRSKADAPDPAADPTADPATA
jgi:trk system potassium uptake protein TrkA